MTDYATGTANRVSASPGYTYTYDFEGNLSAKTETGTGKVTTYSYDHRNRLNGVTRKASAGGAILAQATYTYDAFDRRIKTQTDADGDGVGAPVVTWTVYDGENPYADFNSGGTLQTRYLHGPAVDWLLARTSAAGTSAWYLTDRLGSVRDIASTAGAVIDHIAYDAYGRVTSESTPANGDRFKYTGREYDPVTGLQYNRARYYDAAIGRWTQEDPIGFAAGDANLYRYVGNGPTNATDPSGLASEDAGVPWWNPWSWPGLSLIPQACALDLHAQNWWQDANITDAIKERDVALGLDSRTSSDDARRNARAQAQRPIGPSTANLIEGAETAVAGSYGEAFGLATPKPTGMPGRGGASAGTCTPRRTPDEHHLMTDKNRISKNAGGPYTPKFEELARRRGITLQDAMNKVQLPGHRGPHPRYNEVIWKRLEQATRGKKGKEFNEAFDKALEKIRCETLTPGTDLNKLATGQG